MFTTYRITVATGCVKKAGTDANVYITLFGTQDNSGERLLDNSEDNFEKGKIDTFSIEMSDLGDLEKVRIRHDNSGKNPGWFLEKIVIHNETDDREWTFPCYRWLAVDEDDGKTDRILDTS